MARACPHPSTSLARRSRSALPPSPLAKLHTHTRTRAHTHTHTHRRVQIGTDGGKLPNFGPFESERRRLLAESIAADGAVRTMDEGSVNVANRAVKRQRPVPRINDIIGVACSSIGAWHQLSQSEQAVAVIDPDMCINCGKCYMTCNDSGYQAITFSADTHIPEITTDCTGCTLCVSVCPINDCITMVPRDGPYIPDRGTEFFDTEETA
jgi:dihydropyrimidine dehydrogenase (NADP+)